MELDRRVADRIRLHGRPLIVDLGPAGGGPSLVRWLQAGLDGLLGPGAAEVAARGDGDSGDRAAGSVLVVPVGSSEGDPTSTFSADGLDLRGDFAALAEAAGVPMVEAARLASRYSPATRLIDLLAAESRLPDDLDAFCRTSPLVTGLLERISDQSDRVLELGRVLLLLRPQEAELSDEWASLAGAVTKAPCTVADISRALLRYPWLFATDEVDGRVVVRPRNPLATTLLTGLVPLSGSEHFEVFKALRTQAIDSLSRQDSSDAFVARQIPRQAMASFSFADLFQDALAVLCSDPLALVLEIEREPTLVLNPGAKAVLLSAHRLREVGDRASSLELNALRVGLGDFASQLAESVPQRPWKTIWTRPLPVNANRILLETATPILAMACGRNGELLVGSSDATAWLVDPYGERNIVWAQPDDAGEVRSVGLHESSSGVRTAALVTSDQRIVVVDVDRREVLWSNQSDHDAPLSAVAVSEGEAPLVATSGVDGLVRVVDLRTGALAVGDEWYRNEMQGRGVEVRAMRFLECDGRQMLFLASVDGSLRIIDPLTGQLRFERTITAAVLNGLSLLPDGDDLVLAFGASDGSVTVLTIRFAEGRIEAVEEPRRVLRHRASVGSVLLRRWDGGVVILAGSSDRSWSLTRTDGSRTGEFIEGHQGSVEQIGWVTRNGVDLVVTAGGDGCVRAWVPAAVSQESLFLEKPTRHAGPVTAIEMHLDGPDTVIWTGGADGEVRSWTLDPAESGRPIGRDQAAVSALTRAPGQPGGPGTTRLYFGTRRGELYRLDGQGGKLIDSSLLGIAHDGISAIAATERAGRPVVVSGGQDGAVTIWDGATEEPVATATVNEFGNVSALCVVDRRAADPLLVTGGQNGVLSYRRLDGLVELWRHEFEDPITVAVALPFHSAGVVVGLASGAIFFNRDVRRADLDWSELGRHPVDISGLASFVVGGRLVVASGGLDRTLRLWDLSTRLVLQTIQLDGVPLGVCASSPNVGVATTAGAAVFEFNSDPLILASRAR